MQLFITFVGIQLGPTIKSSKKSYQIQFDLQHLNLKLSSRNQIERCAQKFSAVYDTEFYII